MEYYRVSSGSVVRPILSNFFLGSTVLSSAGNDGRICLWKATNGNVWRSYTSISVEDVEDGSNDRDTEMG